MATIDETNIFGLPLTRQYGLEPKQATPMSEEEKASREEYERIFGNNNKFSITYQTFLEAKEKQKVAEQRKAVAQSLLEGDTTKAYEGFTELPMVTDQLPAYMTPILGNLIDEKERGYLEEKAGREFKDPRDVELEMLMASDPRDVKQFTEKDPVSGAISTLAGASSLIGIGEVPSLFKAGIFSVFPSLRKGMTAKTMDGQGGGGGISDIPPQPKRDFAGFVSSVEKVALGPQKFGSGQDLINYLESPKRSGISSKELKYLDFDQIRNNPNLTKEDVVKYIQDNRPQIYRVQRSEDNPTYSMDSRMKAEGDNELALLPLNEEATRIANTDEDGVLRSTESGAFRSIYEGEGQRSGHNYKIIGNDNNGYTVFFNDEEFETFNDLIDARARVEGLAFDNEDITDVAYTLDSNSNSDQLLDSAPLDVITGEATLPTKYQGYGDYRLPMGGAENYREFTLHIANPRTPTRYSADELGGVKHFGGGDELLHYRTTDRIDEDGKRVLFVEEIQSDLHEAAGSPRRSANYETPIKERQKIANQLEEFGLRANFTGELKGFGNFFYRGEPGTGGEKMIDIGALPSIAREIKAGRTANFGSKNADDFVENFGFEKTQKIGALVEKLETGELPDYPFKGNDWIDLAVKDIIKLADEGGYDRVAFTNAPTQISRTNSNVNFVKDALVRRVPSIEEYAQSSQFKKDFDKAVEAALYNDRKFSNPNITKEELLNQPILTFRPVNPSTILRSIDQDVLKPLNTRGDEIYNFVLNEYFKNNNVRGNLPKYQVEKRSLRIEDKPDYLLTSDSKLADLTSVDEGDFTYLETTDELLAEFPKKMHEQILKDIKAGNIPKSLDDAQIYELNLKEGDGKKYLDLYDSKLKGALNNVVKKLDKDNKPQLKNVLFGEYDEGVSPETLYEAYLGVTRSSEEEAITFSDNIKSLTDRNMLEHGLQKHNAITIDITPKMKKTIAEEGVNVYAKGGIVKKLKSMDKPIAGNTRYV